MIADRIFVTMPSTIHRSESCSPTPLATLIFPSLTRRAGWRDQRPVNNGRRGAGNTYPMNSSKPNQRSEQNQYGPSRPTEQSSNNRQQQYNNTRGTRPTRYNEHRSPHEGRDSPSQIVNDEATRGQRMNSGSFSQGPNSGSTSPSTTAPARPAYPATNTRPPLGRNSPAPYTGSSSSRNNSVTATSPTATPYQTNAPGAGNYSQQGNNKTAKQKPRSLYSCPLLV